MVNSDFYDSTLYTNFAIFLKMAIPIVAIYVEQLKKSFVKIPEFTPVIVFVTFPQK